MLIGLGSLHITAEFMRVLQASRWNMTTITLSSLMLLLSHLMTLASSVCVCTVCLLDCGCMIMHVYTLGHMLEVHF